MQQQQDEMQKIADRLMREMSKAHNVEKAGFVMKSPIEVIMSHSQAQHPNLKFCYVRMKDGREMKFKSIDELVAFIREAAVQGALETESNDNDKNHFREPTETEREELA